MRSDESDLFSDETPQRLPLLPQQLLHHLHRDGCTGLVPPLLTSRDILKGRHRGAVVAFRRPRALAGALEAMRLSRVDAAHKVGDPSLPGAAPRPAPAAADAPGRLTWAGSAGRPPPPPARSADPPLSRRSERAAAGALPAERPADPLPAIGEGRRRGDMAALHWDEDGARTTMMTTRGAPSKGSRPIFDSRVKPMVVSMDVP